MYATGYSRHAQNGRRFLHRHVPAKYELNDVSLPGRERLNGLPDILVFGRLVGLDDLGTRLWRHLSKQPNTGSQPAIAVAGQVMHYGKNKGLERRLAVEARFARQ